MSEILGFMGVTDIDWCLDEPTEIIHRDAPSDPLDLGFGE